MVNRTFDGDYDIQGIPMCAYDFVLSTPSLNLALPKIASMEERCQYGRGASIKMIRSWDAQTVIMKIVSHKRGVLVLQAVNLAPGYELVFKTLFSAVYRQNNRTKPGTQQVLELGSCCNLNNSHYQQYSKRARDIFGRYWERHG